MLRAIIFDLDGTLTEFNLRIDEIKRALGCQNMPILEFLGSLGEEERRRGEELLRREEMRAAEECRLRDGAKEVIEELRTRGLKLGLLTRNNRKATERVLERFQLNFDFVSTRDDGEVKPSKEAMERALTALGVSKSEVLFVGDHEIDRVCGELSGVRTLILGEDIRSLGELIEIVENENKNPLSA